jgi:hypothetical protein
LASDGKVSFAAFIYDNSTAVEQALRGGTKVAGFDAGDHIRSATTPNGHGYPKAVNVFRIDGKEANFIID